MESKFDMADMFGYLAQDGFVFDPIDLSKW
jgi:hypothetical protein